MKNTAEEKRSGARGPIGAATSSASAAGSPHAEDVEANPEVQVNVNVVGVPGEGGQQLHANIPAQQGVLGADASAGLPQQQQQHGAGAGLGSSFPIAAPQDEAIGLAGRLGG